MQIILKTKRQHIPHTEFSQAPTEAAFLAGRSKMRKWIRGPRRAAEELGQTGWGKILP